MGETGGVRERWRKEQTRDEEESGREKKGDARMERKRDWTDSANNALVTRKKRKKYNCQPSWQVFFK